jgi:endonuclease/exonuclease/phosphatase family metal-dependent hydrolase
VAAVLRRLAAQSPNAIIGLCEVDSLSAEVLVQTLGSSWTTVTPVGSPEYLDTVLFFQPEQWELQKSSYHSVFPGYGRGEILTTNLINRSTSVPVSLYTVHLKSRAPNEQETEFIRQAECCYLRNLIWEEHGGKEQTQQLLATKRQGIDVQPPDRFLRYPNCILFGDWNDEPWSRSMQQLNVSYHLQTVVNQPVGDRVLLYNNSWRYLSEEAPGTIVYKPNRRTPWVLFDQVITSPALHTGQNGLEIVPDSFRVIREGLVDEDGIPLNMELYDQSTRKRIGFRENGISDHLPVLISLRFV